MSRFALNWAKKQHPGSVEGKAVLLVLGDQAEGADNTCSLFEQALADAASIDRSQLPAVIQGLKTNEFFRATVLPPKYHPGANYHEMRLKNGDRIKFDLLIPEPRNGSAAPHPSISGDSDRPHAVYRLYDAKGALLYVGESWNPEQRFEGHQLNQPWWFEVATREITWHPNEDLAKAEERRAIRQDCPFYNIKDSPTPYSNETGPQRRRYVKETARWDAYADILRQLRTDLRAGRFDVLPLPTVGALARIHGVGWKLVHQALHELVKAGDVAYVQNPDRSLDGIYVRDWSEW